MIEKARNKGRKVHFASLTDLSHLKNSESEPQYHKYKGRVALRGDIVKDDSGSNAVCTEQGSTASQMTAAKAMDIISRLPGCARQAEDAVSALHQGQNGICTDVQNVQMFGYVYRNTNGPNHGSSMEDPVVPLERNLHGQPLAGLLWERQFEKVLLEHGLEKMGMFFRYTGMFFVNRERLL